MWGGVFFFWLFATLKVTVTGHTLSPSRTHPLTDVEGGLQTSWHVAPVD